MTEPPSFREGGARFPLSGVEKDIAQQADANRLVEERVRVRHDFGLAEERLRKVNQRLGVLSHHHVIKEDRSLQEEAHFPHLVVARELRAPLIVVEGQLTVLERGRIIGNVRASDARIEGTVRGMLTVTGSCELGVRARVAGFGGPLRHGWSVGYRDHEGVVHNVSPDSADAAGITHPILVAQVRCATELLAHATKALLDGYEENSASTWQGYASVKTFLSDLDHLMVLLASSAGALERETITPVILSLSLAANCLQLYLLRRLYDAGGAAEAAVGALDTWTPAPSLPQTLGSREMVAAVKTLRKLLSLLKTADDGYDSPRLRGAPPSWERGAQEAFGGIGGYCRRTMNNLTKVNEPRRHVAQEQAAELSLLPDPILNHCIRKIVAVDELSVALNESEAIAAGICQRLQDNFRYSLVSLQRIRHDGVIEAVIGTGLARSWVGLSGHRLEKEPAIRDIQADVVLRRRVEVIRGNDVRFDQFIYRKHRHDLLVRVFVPIVLFRDVSGAVVEPPDAASWQRDRDPDGPAGELVLSLSLPEGLSADVIGSIEAGFILPNPKGTIGEAEALEVARYVTSEAPNLYRCSIEHALERAVEHVRDVAGADSAALHFFAPVQTLPFFVSAAARQSARFLPRSDVGNGAPPELSPQESEIGIRSLRSRTAVVVRGGDRADPTSVPALDSGTVAAFPLFMGKLEGACFVYGDHEGGMNLEPAVVSGSAIVARRCGQVLAAAFQRTDERDDARRMSALSHAVQSLLDRGQLGTAGALYEAMAWNTLNILGADVVTLCAYNASMSSFDEQPAVAGRLVDAVGTTGPALPDDIRWRVIFETKPIFAAHVSETPALNDPLKIHRPSFVAREHIVSSAAVPLRYLGTPVGLLFINFRTRHEFSSGERAFVGHLADVLAALLRNYRGSWDGIERAASALLLSAQNLRASSPS